MAKHEANYQHSHENALWRQRRPAWYIASVLDRLPKMRQEVCQADYRRVYGGLGSYSYQHVRNGSILSEEDFQKLPMFVSR
jgi:beta-xylosidase